MRIHISPWLVLGAVTTAIVVGVLAAQGWIDVQAFKDVLNLLGSE